MRPLWEMIRLSSLLMPVMSRYRFAVAPVIWPSGLGQLAEHFQSRTGVANLSIIHRD
jgi:hypothetical protein